jgi:hypothetical protein
VRILNQAMAVLGTVVVIAVIAALVTPKTAHAIVATAVNVVNPSASPVPTSNVGPSNEPFFTQTCISHTNSIYCAGVPAFFMVPSNTVDGKTVTRLVIEHVSGICFSNGSGVYSTQLEQVTPTSSQNLANGYNIPNLQFGPGPIAPLAAANDVFTNTQSFSQPMRFYADPGGVVSYQYQVAGDVTYAFCNWYTEGYLATQ